jgi:hypothetical protein
MEAWESVAAAHPMDAVAKNRAELIRRARHLDQPAQDQNGAQLDFAMAQVPGTAATG